MKVSYANATATLALFVALGGTSYAFTSLPANSVGNRQIRNRAVTDAKIRPHSLRARDFRLGDLPGRGLSGAPGAPGAPGPKGETGVAGPPGPATGAAGGDLTGSFPDPAVGPGAITAEKLAAGSVTRTKVAITMVTASVPYAASSIEAITAPCPVGTQVVTGGAGVVGSDQALPLNNVAAVSYSGPTPFGNGWHGEAFRTYTSPPVNSSYGLNVFAVCLAS
jgi:hypothetical protein